MKNKKVADIVMRYSPGKDVDKLQHGEAMGVMLEHLADAASERSVRSVSSSGVSYVSYSHTLSLTSLTFLINLRVMSFILSTLALIFFLT